MAPNFPPHLQSLLSTLHAQSLSQETAIDPAHMSSIRSKYAKDLSTAKTEMNSLMADKFIALDEDKCHFVHGVLRAINARTVVEIGTSYGVSTVYLADAVGRRSDSQAGPDGLVIGTEFEQPKVEIANGIWKQAGSRIAERIRVLVGDLHQTLKSPDFEELMDGRSIDAVLLDIWPYEALPALRLLMPKLRTGAVVITDNSIASREGYKELLTLFRENEGDWQSTTLPYKGGLEMSIYLPNGSCKAEQAD